MASCEFRFANAALFGLNYFYLTAYNGNLATVFDPRIPGWTTVELPSPEAPGYGIIGHVDDCYINNVPHQNAPYGVTHTAFLRMDMNGNLYINNVPGGGRNYVENAKGIMVEPLTGIGHCVGMWIRRPGREIQGNFYQELLISRHNTGLCSIFSHLNGTINAGAWAPIGPDPMVELLIWEDKFPKISASMDVIGTVPGANMQVRIVHNSNFGDGVTRKRTNRGDPQGIDIIYPGAPIEPGYHTFQVFGWCDVGQMTISEGTLDIGAATF